MAANRRAKKDKKRSEKKDPRGRPTRDNLSERRLVRLTPALDAIVEKHRQAMQREPDEPVEFTKAMRDLLRIGAKTAGYIEDENGNNSEAPKTEK